MKKISERYDNLDLLKCISMLMVVSLHTGLWHTNYIKYNTFACFIEYYFHALCIGVPIFVFINGYLLINKDVDLFKHFKKCIKIIILIIIWSIIPFIIINLIQNTKFSFGDVINNTLNINVNNFYNGPLWFLQKLLIIYFAYPIINYIFKNNKKIYYYLFYILLFFTFFSNSLLIVNDIIKIKYINSIIAFVNSFNPIGSNTLLFYFILGGVVFDKKEFFIDIKNRLIIILSSLFLYIIFIFFTFYIFKYKNVPFTDNYLNGSVITPLMLIGFYTLTFAYKYKNHFYNKIIKSIGSNTLGIFLIHVPLKRVFFHYNIIKLEFFLSRLYFFIVIFILSYLITFILKKIPYVNKIISI